jgi:hypothetical protein
MNMVFIGRIAAGLALVATLAFAKKQPQPKSQKEVDALQAMFNAPNADVRIAAVDALLKNFATPGQGQSLLYADGVGRRENDYERSSSMANARSRRTRRITLSC